MRDTRNLLPWAVWSVATLAYAVAIINRSSLAALGPATQEHFGIDATTLAMFAMIQLVVYAGLQIPVGMLLDRAGPTVLILAGGVLMLSGQVVMATVFDVRLAILARVLVGAGDACTFISVMSLLPEWFTVRQLPLISQITALLGQAGQLISVAPLALAVDLFGWASGFLGIAAVGLLVTLLGVLVLRDAPGTGTVLERVTGSIGRVSGGARPLGVSGGTAEHTVAPPSTEAVSVVGGSRSFWARLRSLLAIPGTRLAFWVHFTSPFALHVFVLLWGTPFLVGGIGLSQPAAAGMLSITVFTSMLGGVLLGSFSSRFMERRVGMYLGVVIAIMLTWCAVLLWPGIPPTWLMWLLMIAISFGGPASMIAFEVLRSHSPRSFAGLGTGLVNMGGFISALLVIMLIGLLLDLQGAGSPENYSLGAFRWAFAAQIPFWALGITMVLVEDGRTKGWMRRHGRTLR